MDVANKSHLVEIVATFKEITALVTAAPTVAAAVDGLAKAMADLLPAHLRCGVTVVSQGQPTAVAATALPDAVLDEARYADGDGPCMAAIRARDIVISRNLVDEVRWPTWTALATHHGIRGVLSYPFDVDTHTLGAINLYADRPEAFSDDVPVIAMLVADHASLLLRVRRQQLAAEDLATQAAEQRGDEVCVERAVGIVMAQRGCPPEQALRHLHDAATHLGVGLPAIAQRLVQTVGGRGSPA